MVETDISSLKQFGKQINKTQPKNSIENKQEIKKEKKISHFKKSLNKYKKQLLRQKKNIFFSMKKNYENRQLTRILNKKQKEQYGNQRKKMRPVKYTFLKESKKQIGNTTIIIRKRVQKIPSQMCNDSFDKDSSNIFDIFIPYDNE